MAVRIQMRRGTSSEWNDADPILNEGEIGYNSTLGQIKVGDGSTIWSELTYLATESELNTSLEGYIALTEKGAVDGVAELDAKISGLEVSMSIIKRLIAKETNLDAKFLHMIKLNEEKLKRKTMLAELEGYSATAKFHQYNTLYLKDQK